MRKNFLGTLMSLALVLVGDGYGATRAVGATWTSPDGAISVTLPNIRNLACLKTSPSTLAAWRTQDGSLLFIITKTPRTPGVPLVQTMVEEEYLKAFHATLVDSKVYQVGRYRVFGMSARGSVKGKEATIIKSTVAVGDQTYDMMAIGLNKKDVFHDRDAKAFIDSLRITPGDADGSSGELRNADQMQVSAAPGGPTWTSPDGAISVRIPTVRNLVQLKVSPPGLAAWATEDMSLEFVIAKAVLPRGEPLVQRSAEAGFLKVTNGALIESAVYEVGGYRVFRMAARGKFKNKDATATQSLVAIGEYVYTILAVDAGKDVVGNPNARRFIDSLRIHSKNTAGSAGNVVNAAQMRVSSPPFVTIVDKVLPIACLPLLIFILYGFTVVLARRLRGRQHAGKRNAWVNLYTVFAALCVVLAISGFWENVKTVLREDLPLEPAARRGFLTGMFGVSAMLVVAAAVLVFQAIRKSRSTGAEMASFAHAPTKGSDLRVTPAADGQDVATDDGQAMNGQKA